MSPFSNVVRLLAILFLFFTLNNPVSAASGRTDYDLDDDGLIEIDDLADLNEIRNNLDGTRLYGVNTGCPAQGCNGFELTTNLDFDTNSDGTIDDNDDYWNSGSGWAPIGASSSSFFSASFEGNGHLIRNLYINQTSSNYIGLFGYTQDATISNVGLSGELMQVNGNSSVGSLVGRAATQTSIRNSFSTGAVSGASNYVGSIVGYANGATITNSFSTGGVIGSSRIGRLVGYAVGSTITKSFATTALRGELTYYVGGLIGKDLSTTVTNSYWATDVTGHNSSSNGPIENGYLGDTLANLKCPTAASSLANSGCGSNNLYTDWDTNVWDFGTSNQLPGLIFGGTTYRDSDGDGVLDTDDAWPLLYAASEDTDGDGHPDTFNPFCDAGCMTASGLTLDLFPDNATAWRDDDLDGLPENCDSSCTASGLTPDANPDDFDNDGAKTDADKDDNDDAKVDADADSNGLIDIHTLAQLNAMRFDLQGLGRVSSEGGVRDSSGCPPRIYEGVLKSVCRGYELKADLDFDTNGNSDLSDDAFWNDGSGWAPIGPSSLSYFATTFEGNGHQIRNLYINRTSSEYIGLFGFAQDATISNVGLSGKLMQVNGDRSVGSLLGNAGTYTSISSSFSTGAVRGSFIVGGLVGGSSGSASITNSFASGTVSGSTEFIGGLVGTADSSTISNSFAIGSVSGSDQIGGLVGYVSSTTITNSYWATDNTGQISSSNSSPNNGYLGDTLANLQCPTTSNNSICGSNTLYAGWDTTSWDFGSIRQLPGLIIGGIIYRDSDGDGLLDSDELDTDRDGVPDDSDDLPEDINEWVDFDGDGIGNNADTDDDNDMVSDDDDAFPLNSSESVDTDGDGIGDNADTDDDNDGVPDTEDPDNSADNGAPEMLSVGAELFVSADQESGTVAYLDYLILQNNLSASDALDATSALTYQGSIDGEVLVSDQDGKVHIATGLQVIAWTATDTSGNVSSVMEQVVNVYPQIRFVTASSTTGEASNIEIGVILSGESPEYPVTVQLSFDSTGSTASATDFDNLDLESTQTLVIEAGTQSALNTLGSLTLSTLDDNIIESDEVLLINLDGVVLSDSEATNYYLLDNANAQHSLTITDTNLAPQVSITLTQKGKSVNSITIGGGDVTLSANISDGNGNDTHNLTWDLDGLATASSGETSVTFSADNLTAGDYILNVTATDSGIPALSDSDQLTISVVAADNESTSGGGVGGGGGGGGSIFWLLLMPLLLARCCCRIKSYR